MSEENEIEYETSGEEYWKVLRPAELAATFGMKKIEVEMPIWHDLMAGQGRAWEILRRLFRVLSVMEPEMDDTRPWTAAEIASKMGVSEELVNEEVANAVKQWELLRAENGVKAGVAAITDEEMNHLTRFSKGEGMTDEVISQLLKAFGFDHIQKDKVLRAEVASRIVSLKDWLNSPHKRTGARELIRTEISMHAMDSLLIGYRNKLAKYQEEDGSMGEDGMILVDRSAEIDSLATKISNLEKQMREMSASHAKKQEDIGANDLDMTARKRIYVETVSHLIDACREFESDPENWRPDGIFTAQEIDWLLEPSGERGPQYRLDIVDVAMEAVRPENLWNPLYEPKKVTRRVCQELATLINGMRGIPQNAEPLPERDEDDEEDGVVADDVMSVPIGEGDASSAVPVQPARGAVAMGVF